MLRQLVAIVFSLVAFPVAAQAELVLREAVFDIDLADCTEANGMEEAESDGQVLFLGDVLLELAPEDVLAIELVDVDSWGRPVVGLTFAQDAAEAFADITEARIGKAIAIVMEGRVLSAPVVQERIAAGQLQITGLASIEEAEALVGAFREAGTAIDPQTRQLVAMGALRARVDRSTPRGAAAAILQAADVGDPLVLAIALHPVAAAAARRQLEPEMDAFVEWLPERSEEERRQVARGIGMEVLPSEPAAYSDVQVVALALAFGWAGEVEAPVTSGGTIDLGWHLMPLLMDLERLRDLPRIALVTETSADQAYVVVEPEAMMDGALSAARVLSFRQLDGEWRLQPSTWASAP